MQVVTGEAVKLGQQLRRVTMGYLDAFRVTLAHNLPTAAHVSMLKASLQVLRNVPCKPRELIFEDWHATAACVAELQALKTMPVLLQSDDAKDGRLSLFFHSCGTEPGPADTWPIARLPLVLPQSYCVWAILGEQLAPAELRGFLHNAPADRSAECPLDIQVYGVTEEWVRVANARMQSAGTYPHVHVMTP